MRTERLVLEKFREDDFKSCRSLVQHEQVLGMVTGRTLTDQEQEVKFESVLAINRAHAAFGRFAARTISKHVLTGLGKIILAEEEEAKTGYLLLPENWGMGYVSEITQCLVEHAGSIPQLKTLSAIIGPENIAFEMIFKKNGFRLFIACTQGNLPAALYKHTLL